MATTIEEYVEKNTRIITTSSGTSFKIKSLGAKETLILLGLFEDNEGPLDGTNVTKFIRRNYDDIIKCVYPSVIEPKIPAEDIKLIDLSEMLTELINLSGLGPKETEERANFRPEPGSPES